MDNRIYRRHPKRRPIRHRGPMAAAYMPLLSAVFALAASDDNASSSTPSRGSLTNSLKLARITHPS